MPAHQSTMKIDLIMTSVSLSRLPARRWLTSSAPRDRSAANRGSLRRPGGSVIGRRVGA